MEPGAFKEQTVEHVETNSIILYQVYNRCKREIY